MEEWVGSHWHRFVTRRGEAPASPHAARLADVRQPVELLLRIGGGPQRLAVALPVRVGGPRSAWQRIAGTGGKVRLAQADGEALALPETVDAFDDAVMNRDLYLWWAALAGSLDVRLPWQRANQEAIPRALARFPGLRDRWARLWRADRDWANGAQAPGAALPYPDDGPPVWTWIVPCTAGMLDAVAPAPDSESMPRQPPSQRLAGRRRARSIDTTRPRAPLLLAPKGEWLKTFADPLRIGRDHDDTDDGDADVAAEELINPTLQRDSESVAARVRFDLDLPSAAADDLPAGPGEWLPEWDARSGRLQPDWVLAQGFVSRETAAWQPPATLRATAARIRRRMDRQRAAPRWQRGVSDGETIDLDAWVRARGEAPGPGSEAVYRRRVRGARELATLLVADLSLSTDTYANDHQRVIDVVREALYVFGEALAGSGDAFAMLGFSSVRRQLRLHELKAFDEAWGNPARTRLGALRPGYYTRMGAALRAGTRRLAARPERQRLLLLLTDGKPHDLDGYDGRFGIEDTRQAVLEARRAGLLPFALSIDAEAGVAMPQLFGRDGWAWVRRPEDLPARLAALYGQLTR